MTQRTITLSNMTVHRKIDENGDLILYTCLMNDGSEIPIDWHEGHADFMELNIEFSIKEIIYDLIDWHSILHFDDDTLNKVEDIWFPEEDRALVELHKQELQKGIDRLNEIKFWKEK